MNMATGLDPTTDPAEALDAASEVDGLSIEITDTEVIHRSKGSEVRMPKARWAELIQATGRFGVATVVRHGGRE